MSIAGLLRRASSKCRTIDKVDIFGDGSGVALYQLDGNANDTGGQYHGTETAVTYGGGTYGRGAILATGKIDCGAGSKALMPSTSAYSVSAWIKRTSAERNVIAARMNTATVFGDDLYWESDNTIKIQLPTDAGTTANTWATSAINKVGDGIFHHVVLVVRRTLSPLIYLDGVLISWNTTGTVANSYDNNLNTLIGAFHNTNYNGNYDQVRFFNRAITETEVATLYAECAPTSIVDNANPFEDNSLKAMYQFNGNANDLTGVYNGTATNVTYSASKFGDCAVLNGTALISTSFAFSANVFSYSVWATVTTVSSTIQSIIDFTTNRAMLSSGNGTNSYVSYYDGGTYRTFGAYSLPSNTRVLLTLVVNGTTAYLYADGVLKGSSACTAIIPSGGMYFGRYAGSASGFLTGNLDQVRIFNKALTPMEVASLYTETTPMEEPLAYQVDPFKDGSGKALYRLEGNALDESGNYNGTATSVTYGNGISGRCCTTTGGKIQLPSKDLFPSTLDVSIASWVKINTSNTYNAIASRDNSASNRGDSIYLNSSTKVLSFTMALSISTVQTVSSSPITAFNDNNFHYVVFTFNRTSKVVTFYVDGINVYQTTMANSISYDNGINVSLISSNNATYAGTLDQVRFFNRTLTQTEVTQLYINLA